MRNICIPLALAALLPSAALAQTDPTSEKLLVAVPDAHIDTLQELEAFTKVIRGLPVEERADALLAVRIDPRIIGGKTVRIQDHPWQVALIEGGTVLRYQFCGGSLIAPNVVITAAHCIDNSIVNGDAANVEIVAGTALYPERGERLKVQAIYVHPQWDSNSQDYDFAILKLAGDSTAGHPVALGRDSPAAGTRVWVTGWGALTEGAQGSPRLMGVETHIVDNDTCNLKESYAGSVTPRMLCAGEREGALDSCQGDSGGPLTSWTTGTPQLIGVVSFGEGCGRRLKYGVYSRISNVTPWIESFLQH